MPPAAALECERTGWTLLMIATLAPALAAARAPRCPASPAPMMRTSCAGMARKPIWTLRRTIRRPVATADPIRVMVVDDQSDLRFLVGVILGDHADIAIVAEADGAASALEQLEQTAPEVAIVDARMPIVDGYELTQRLLQLRPQMRIALLTSIVDEVIEDEARAAGAAACVSKGDFDALPDVVRGLVGR